MKIMFTTINPSDLRYNKVMFCYVNYIKWGVRGPESCRYVSIKIDGTF